MSKSNSFSFNKSLRDGPTCIHITAQPKPANPTLATVTVQHTHPRNRVLPNRFPPNAGRLNASPIPLMDAASRTWPPPNPSPAPFSSRFRMSSDPHRRRRRRHSKKPKPEPPLPAPKTAPIGSGADFAALPQELLHKALSASGATDVSAASRACRAWRDALQPLREAAALHAYGRRLKHGPGPGTCGGEGRDVARQSALGLFQRAARLGSAAAMVDAGLMCWEEGQREEAVGYYQSAAELGHPVGMCNLGVSYLEGITDFTKGNFPFVDTCLRWVAKRLGQIWLVPECPTCVDFRGIIDCSASCVFLLLGKWLLGLLFATKFFISRHKKCGIDKLPNLFTLQMIHPRPRKLLDGFIQLQPQAMFVPNTT